MNAQNATTNTTQTNLFSVSDEDFDEKVLRSPLPVVVDFWADWCHHCHNLAPIYERLSNEYAGKLRFAKLNGSEQELAPVRYGVMGFPTLLIFHEGKEIGRLVGPHPTRLQRLLDRVLAENVVSKPE